MAEAVKQSLEAAGSVNQRALEVMARQTTAYDYEKVFWNSTYSLGLFGLGWVAIKLGQMIKSMATLPSQIATSTETVGALVKGDINQTIFDFIFDRVEGKSKNDPIPSAFDYILKQMATTLWNPLILVGAIGALTNANEFKYWQAIKTYREDSSAWAKFKAEMKDKGLDVHETTSSTNGALPQGDIVDVIDGFFNTYGSIIPVGIVAGHAALEYLRKRRYLGQWDRVAGDTTLAVGGAAAGIAALGQYAKA